MDALRQALKGNVLLGPPPEPMVTVINLKGLKTLCEAELAARAERESELAAKLTQANERVSKLEGDALREKLAALAEGWYGEADKHVDMLLKLAQLDGEGGESFQFYVQTQNALAEQVRQSDLFKERGTDKPGQFTSALERANALALARAKDGTAFGQALEAVFREQPALYEQYTSEVRGGK